jgi:hypothetical protein
MYEPTTCPANPGREPELLHAASSVTVITRLKSVADFGKIEVKFCTITLFYTDMALKALVLGGEEN